MLLIGNVRAKVTDFGMAKLKEHLSDSTAACALTKNPGSDAYMPPEAVKSPTVYTEKLDCFSFGVLIVQVLTRKLPNPGDQHKEVIRPLMEFGESRSLFEGIPEIRRRENHISEVDPNHPLLSIGLSCLKDKDIERPSAMHLCDTIGTLKGDPRYSQSAREAKESTADQQGKSHAIKHLIPWM